MEYIEVEEIEKAKQGSTQAIEKIFRAYNGLIKNCASRYFSVGLESDDLIQEAMIGLYKAIQNFDNQKEGNFTAFAKLCITRQLISTIKTANRQKHKALNESLWEDEILPEEISRSGESIKNSPENLLVEKEVLKELYDQIQKKLSPLESKVLLLHAQGFDYKTISAKLEITSKTVDNSLQRARKKLAHWDIAAYN